MKKSLFLVLCLVFLLSMVCFGCCTKQEDQRVNALELRSSSFSVNLAEKTAYLKVANSIADYDFSDKFTVAEDARFDVCTDKQCNNKIASKKTDIAVGNNVFYILVTNGNDVASYTITLRRHPIYTITFKTNDGEEIKTQQVEEDCLVEEPTFFLRGYEFMGCDYNFSSPILKDETITAKFSVKEEMKNYKFTSTAYSCAIIGVKDKTITKAVIPDYVTSIGDGAFYMCKELEKIIISDSVTSIGQVAFLDCNGLKFNEYDNALYLGNENNPYYALIKVKSKDITHCIISEGCKVVSDSAFQDCTSLTSITIPDGLTFIGDKSFYNCSGIDSITISKGVTSIGNGAFGGCSGVIRVTIPNSVKNIGVIAFSDCIKLKEIYFDGTRKQWAEIKKAASWDNNIGEYIVYCIDGNIVK